MTHRIDLATPAIRARILATPHRLPRLDDRTPQQIQAARTTPPRATHRHRCCKTHGHTHH